MVRDDFHPPSAISCDIGKSSLSFRHQAHCPSHAARLEEELIETELIELS
jgi:hypothetical protein